MTHKSEYDVVIIGAGLGGLIVGALLAQKERKQVLILEKEGRVGGRLIHFHGDDIQKPEDYMKPLGKIQGWLADSEPDFKTIIEKRLLSGYSFDVGFHGILAGKYGRVFHILHSLGKKNTQERIVPYNGFGYWDEGKLYAISGKQKFPWMSDEDYEEVHKLSAEIFKMSTEEAHSYDHISIAEWLKQRTDRPKVIDFFHLMALLVQGFNAPANYSAGDYILVARDVVRAGTRFSGGSVGQALEPDGLAAIAYDLADSFTTHGGELQLNRRVEKVIIDGQKAVGVVVKDENGRQEIRVNTVVCNEPIQMALSKGLIPSQYLPQDFVQKIQNLVPVGCITPIYGLNRKVLEIFGMYNTWLYLNEPGLPEKVAFCYAPHSLL